MAAMTVYGLGVATADAELKYVGDKKSAVCSVNLAFNRNWKDGKGEWQKEVCFMRGQVWGSRAERMAELVKKGQPLYVSGYMKQDNWEDSKTGAKRVAFSIAIQDFQLCVKNSKNDDGAKNAEPVGSAQSQSGANDESSSDMPF